MSTEFMNYLARQIVFREVPEEISLSYLITGCPTRCPGCHSSDSWIPDAGQPLTTESFVADLEKYADWITCVLFMGGEWHRVQLINLLRIARGRGLKTALYTGLEDISEELKDELDYLKVGPYLKERGGLDSPLTNQKLIEVKTGKLLNSHFQH